MGKKKRSEAVKVTPAPPKSVNYKGYTAVQSRRNNHVMIGKNGKMVYHAQWECPLTEDELRKLVDDYIRRTEGGGLIQ